MTINQIGPIIRVKEEIKIGFYSPRCCGPIVTRADGVQYPEYRCREHNIQFCKHKRIKKTKIKFKNKFDYKRHKFIKMLTFGLPGEKTTTNEIVDTIIKQPFIRKEYSKLQYIQEATDIRECERDHERWRTELRSRFNKLRRDKWWNKHVDGGIWFYETVLTENGDEGDMKIHPHFHCMILGPKNLAGQNKDFNELNDLFEKHGLGKPSVSVAKNKDGKTINASLDSSLWYLTNYLKKQEHSEGKNRGSFGIFNKRSKKVK